jgi:hypothetical protein
MDIEEFGSSLDVVSVAIVGEAGFRVLVMCKCGRVGGGVRK